MQKKEISTQKKYERETRNWVLKKNLCVLTTTGNIPVFNKFTICQYPRVA